MPSPITVNVNFIDLTGNTVSGYMQAVIQSPTGVYDLYVAGLGILAPKITTSNTGTSVSVSIWGNDVVVDNADSALDTYYIVTLYNTSNLPIWTAAYSFTGSGPINLVGYPALTSIPTVSGPVPTNILTSNNIFTGTNAFNNSANFSGSVSFTGNNIHTGTEIFANINNELWVCPTCLYTTIAAAYAALPNCTITPTPVAANGTAGSSVTVPCGTIRIAPGNYPTPASTVTINSSFVRIIGSGTFNTILNCSTACYVINGATSWGGTVTAYPGGFQDVDIEGGGSGITGLTYIDATGLQLHRVRIAGFTGAGGQGLMIQNDSGGQAYSERMNWSDVILDNNKTLLRLDTAVGGTFSMGHQNWNGIKFQCNNGQTVLKMTGVTQLFASDINGVINTYPPGTNTCTGIDLSGLTGTGVMRDWFRITVDNGGNVTYSDNGLTASNFQVLGYQSAVGTGANPVNTNFYEPIRIAFANQSNGDILLLDGVGAGKSFNLGFFDNGNIQWRLNKSSTNSLNFFDVAALQNAISLSNNGTRTIFSPDAAKSVNVSNSGTQLVGAFSPQVAGGVGLGTAALPFSNLIIGGAATNNFTFTPASTTGARTVNILDPLQTTTSLPLVIASGTKALNTASITTATCDAGVAATATGTLSTDTVDWSFNAAPTATDKYGAFLVVYAVPSANTVTFYTCNPSATTSTPTAMTVNWSVRRP